MVALPYQQPGIVAAYIQVAGRQLQRTLQQYSAVFRSSSGPPRPPGAHRGNVQWMAEQCSRSQVRRCSSGIFSTRLRIFWSSRSSLPASCSPAATGHAFAGAATARASAVSFEVLPRQSQQVRVTAPGRRVIGRQSSYFLEELQCQFMETHGGAGARFLILMGDFFPRFWRGGFGTRRRGFEATGRNGRPRERRNGSSRSIPRRAELPRRKSPEARKWSGHLGWRRLLRHVSASPVG